MIRFNINWFYLLFATILVAFTACNSETEMVDETAFGYEYFPLKSGKSWTYASDSIIYTSGGNKKDTLHSYIKEEVGEYFLDEVGDTTYQIYRFFKRDLLDPWTKINTWTATKDETRAIRTEENIKFVKLVFPISIDVRFDGNVFVDKSLKVDVGGEQIEPYNNWKHRIEAVDAEFVYKNQNIKSVIIALVDDISIIDRRKVTEHYGEGIGLVKKEMVILDSDGSKPNDPWETKAQKGFVHTLTLIDNY